MQRFTLAPRRRIPAQTLVLLAACLLSPWSAAAKNISPDEWFYEIDGDYGSKIADFVADRADKDPLQDEHDVDEVRDGDVTTVGAREGSCSEWGHTTDRPYMGSRAYTVSCLAHTGPDTIRGEQHFVQGLRPGPDNKRYVSMAVRLVAPPIPRKRAGAWMAQLHNKNLTIPFFLNWVAEPETTDRGPPGYYLDAVTRHELPIEVVRPERSRRQAVRLGRVTPNTWIRLLIQLDLGKGNNRRCPGSTANDATWAVQLMDNATGLWREPVRPEPDHQVGNRYDETNCPPAEEFNTNFKVGMYSVEFTHRVDYDNITYGKRWANVTKNHLIGYKKSVLRLAFHEASGRRVDDASYTWNGGRHLDPLFDYDNDGTIEGAVTRIGNGLFGSALRFPGTPGSYVKVPISARVVDDFDVGNYMTVSAWVRTREKPADHKGLVVIDEGSDSKLLLTMRGNAIGFGVRHPSTGAPVYSRLDYAFHPDLLADGNWHLVTGTFNRFARRIPTPADPARVPQRIKLYIDGRKVMEREGHDLPILRGQDQLAVGKYSTGGFAGSFRGYFKGDIDDVGLFNFTMSDREVEELWRRRGALERLQ